MFAGEMVYQCKTADVKFIIADDTAIDVSLEALEQLPDVQVSGMFIDRKSSIVILSSRIADTIRARSTVITNTPLEIYHLL